MHLRKVGGALVAATLTLTGWAIFSFKVPVCHNSLPYLSTKKASLGAEGSIGDWSCSTGAEETGNKCSLPFTRQSALALLFFQHRRNIRVNSSTMLSNRALEFIAKFFALPPNSYWRIRYFTITRFQDIVRYGEPAFSFIFGNRCYLNVLEYHLNVLEYLLFYQIHCGLL